MEPLEHYAATGPIYFYGGRLSSFACRPILRLPGFYNADRDALDPVLYDSREEFFQSAKATTLLDHNKILAARPDTWRVKARGQRVELRPDWEQVKYRYMLGHIVVEVACYPDLADWLLTTEHRLIAEDSPKDFIWGIRDGEGGMGGQNLLGLAWMHAREIRMGATVLEAVNALYDAGWVRDTGTMDLLVAAA